MLASLLKNRRFLSAIGIYTFSNVLNSAIPFILLPVLTNYLSPADYGILTNLNGLINILIPFISLNLMTSLQVIFVKDKNELGNYISTGLSVMVLLSICFALFLLVFSGQLADLLQVPEEWIVLAVSFALYQNFVEVLLSVWRMEEKAISYGVFRVLRTILEITLALVLIVVNDLRFEGSILAMAYSYGIGAVIALIIVYRKGLIKWTFSRKHANYLINYGVPLIPHVLGSVMIMYTDKVLLTEYHGLASNGIYSVGFMVGQVIGLLQNSFNQAWVPYAFKSLRSGTATEKYKLVKWTYIYFIGILIITILFYFCSPIIFMVLGHEFKEGLSLVLWIALGFAFNGMYKMVSVYFFYYERTKFIGFISMASAAINVVLAILLIPHYSFHGAAISTMLAFFIQFLFTWIWSTKLVSMPWGLLVKSKQDE